MDDTGKRFELSPDPLLDQLRSQLSGVQLGEPADVHAALQGILSNTAIFGSNLYNTGLAETVEAYFRELMAGPGAVRATLKKYVTKEN